MEKVRAKITNSKNDIYKIYKQHIEDINEKLKNIELVDSSTIQAEKRKSEVSAKASEIKTTSLDATIADVITNCKKSLEDVVTNIKTKTEERAILEEDIENKKAQLKEIFDIETEANSLAALINTHATVREMRNEEIADLNSQIDDLKNTIRNLETEYSEKHSEMISRLQIDQKRKQDEFEYEFSRTKMIKMNELNDELKVLSHKLDEREASVKEREATMDELENQLHSAKNEIISLKENQEELINEAIAKTKKKAEESAAASANIMKTRHEADIKIKDSEIAGYKNQIEDLKTQIIDMKNSLNAATSHVQNIAVQALQSQGDAATIARVAEVAAGGKNSK